MEQQLEGRLERQVLRLAEGAAVGAMARLQASKRRRTERRARTSVERGTSVPHVPRLNRVNLRSCKSYCCTVLFSLFNTVPNILSLVKSGFLPVSVCFFQNSDLRIMRLRIQNSLTRIEAQTVPRSTVRSSHDHAHDRTSSDPQCPDRLTPAARFICEFQERSIRNETRIHLWYDFPNANL